MASITLNGVIVYDLDDRQYHFKDHFTADDFPGGVWNTDYSHYVLVCKHMTTVEVPNDIDLITPQLHDLDRQEADLAVKYHAAKTQIAAKRQSLLAIECDPTITV